MREFSAPYHPQSMGLVEGFNQTIPDVLNKMGLEDEDWDLYLPLTQYSYNTMLRPMFQGMSFHEVVYGFRPPEFVRFSRKLQLPEHFVQTLEDFISMRKNVAEATFHMIHTDHTDFYKRQDLRWYQQMKAGTRLADNIPIATWISMDMFSKDNPPKMVPRFNGPFIVTRNLIEEL